MVMVWKLGKKDGTEISEVTTPITNQEPPRKRIGLVLGSGSSRGWAHIGVIDALEEEGFPIDYIVGCSIGAYVGAIYAAGGLQSLKDFVLKMDGKKVFSYFDVVFPRSGLLNATKKLKELFFMHTQATDFSDLRIPVLMVATDLQTGEKVILKSGNLLDALRATMSVPGLFAPARIKDRWLVDGGLVDPVPVGVARAEEADMVIAVDLSGTIASRQKTPLKLPRRQKRAEPAVDEGRSYAGELMNKLSGFYQSAEAGFKAKIGELLQQESPAPDIIETVTTSIAIMQRRINRINLAVDPPDILIEPRLGELKMMDFDQVAHTIEEGYIAAKEKMEDVRNLFESTDGA
jgi:NTE family protein